MVGVVAVVGELTFEDICAALRRKDPSVTKVVDFQSQDNLRGYTPAVELTNANARRLGEDLHGNPHVTSITLNLSFFEEEAADSDSCALLLQFIRESTSLKDVDLRVVEYEGGLGFLMSRTIVQRLFFAIAESSTIRKLVLSGLVVDPMGFDTVMKSTKSLKKLTISTCDFGNVASREMVAEALGANMTLKSLCIRTFPGDHSMVEPVLLRIGTHPCLRELHLCSLGDRRQSLGYVDSLAYFLHTSRTLEHLRLASYGFLKDTLKPVLEGIHSNELLTRLTIGNCNFDVESTSLFADILKPKIFKNTIRELHFKNNINFGGRPVGAVVASMLSPKQIDGDDGSKKDEIMALDVLSMTVSPFSIASLAPVFKILGNKAASIQLHCFRYHYGRLDLAGCDALAASLPKLIYLKELSLLNVDARPLNGSQMRRERLLRALKQNWSLQDLQITLRLYPPVAHAPPFTDDDLRRIKLYCKRNQTIPSLVANARLGDDDDDKTSRYLFPKLFAAAKQAPSAAPNSMLSGLLALGDTVGRQYGGKRVRRSDSVV
jgi:hypothetical protein